jgi:hypothetical protein
MHFFVFSANMADNDEAGASKPFSQQSEEIEEQPRHDMDVEDADTDPDYTTDGATGDDTTDGGDSTYDGQPKRQRRTVTRMCSTP